MFVRDKHNKIVSVSVPCCFGHYHAIDCPMFGCSGGGACRSECYVVTARFHRILMVLPYGAF